MVFFCSVFHKRRNLLMPKSGEQASRMFSRVAFLDQPAIIKATRSCPNETCSDAKVNDDSRRWRNENKECIKRS